MLAGLFFGFVLGFVCFCFFCNFFCLFAFSLVFCFVLWGGLFCFFGRGSTQHPKHINLPEDWEGRC